MAKSLINQCLKHIACHSHGYSTWDLEWLPWLPTVLLEQLAEYLSPFELLRLKEVFLKAGVSIDGVLDQLLQKWAVGRSMKFWMTGRPLFEVYLSCFYHVILRAPRHEALEAYQKAFNEGVNGKICCMPRRVPTDEELPKRRHQDLLKYAPQISHLSFVSLKHLEELLQHKVLLSLLALSVTHLKFELSHGRPRLALEKFCSYMLTHGCFESVFLKGRYSHADTKEFFKVLAGTPSMPGDVIPSGDEHSGSDAQDLQKQRKGKKQQLERHGETNPDEVDIETKTLQAASGMSSNDMGNEESHPSTSCHSDNLAATCATVSSRGVCHVEIHDFVVDNLGTLLSIFLRQSAYLQSLKLSCLFMFRLHMLNQVNEWDELLDTLLVCLADGPMQSLVINYSPMFTSAKLLRFLCILAQRYVKNEPLSTLHIEEGVISTFGPDHPFGQSRMSGCATGEVTWENLLANLHDRPCSLVKNFRLKVDKKCEKGLVEFALWLVNHNAALTHLQLDISQVSASSPFSQQHCEVVFEGAPDHANAVTTTEAWSMLIVDLRRCSQLEVLELRHIDLTGKDLVSLGHALPQLQNLTSLTLEDCRFQFNPDHTQQDVDLAVGRSDGHGARLQVFCSALCNHPKLCEVHLPGNHLGMHGVTLLRFILSSIHHDQPLSLKHGRADCLRSLDLSQNSLPIDALLELGEELASRGKSSDSRPPILQRLDLQGAINSLNGNCIDVDNDAEVIRKISRLYCSYAAKVVFTKVIRDVFSENLEYVAQM